MARVLLLMLVSLGLAGASAFAGWLELAPYVQPHRDAVDAYRSLAVAPPPSGLSLQLGQLGLVSCVDALVSLEHRTQPRSLSDRVVANCATAADRALADNPGYSLAWLLSALVADEQGATIEAAVRLANSQRVGPAEQWLARMRVELTEQLRPSLSQAALAFSDADLALMVQSYSGVATIAERYVAEPEFRQRITDIVDRLPERDQARFVGWVASAVRARER
jgi:hypothetical protein